jgi:aspartate 1-decarboxylase
MFVHLLKSKIHRVKITQAELNYIGSVTIDEDLMDAASLFEGEKVQIVNLNNGERLETYVIRGGRGTGMICLNGPAARRAAVGDKVIIIAYCMLSDAEARAYKPVLVFPDEDTNLLK